MRNCDSFIIACKQNFMYTNNSTASYSVNTDFIRFTFFAL